MATVLKAILNRVTTVPLLQFPWQSDGLYRLKSNAVQLSLGCLPDAVCDWLKSSHPAEPCQPTPPALTSCSGEVRNGWRNA